MIVITHFAIFDALTCMSTFTLEHMSPCTAAPK